MTLPEYLLLLKTHLEDEEEKEYDRHWRAFLQMAVQSTKGKGKNQRLRYSTFSKFYDREKVMEQIKNIEEGKKREEDNRIKRLIDYKKSKAR